MGKTINPSTNTKFEGGFPQEFLEHCYNGGSVPQFCRLKRISRTTFDAWCDKYPKMKAAKTTGKLWAEGWWMDEGQHHLVTQTGKFGAGERFDTNLYKFIMGGRFGHTADKDAHDRLDKIEEHMAKAAATQMRESAIAEEAEYEIIEGEENGT